MGWTKQSKSDLKWTVWADVWAIWRTDSVQLETRVYDVFIYISLFSEQIRGWLYSNGQFGQVKTKKAIDQIDNS